MIVKQDTRKLTALVKTLRQSQPVARVGILGGGGSRSDGTTNAKVGAKHEFGSATEGLPIRSWLRMPIMEKLQGELSRAGAFDPKESARQVMTDKSLLQWVKKVGAMAEAVIQEAFDTGGFGRWKPSFMPLKKNKQTLVETSQLRRSVTSEVVGK